MECSYFSSDPKPTGPPQTLFVGSVDLHYSLIHFQKVDRANSRASSTVIMSSARRSLSRFEAPCHEDHDELLAKLPICEHYDAIYDVRRNDVPRWYLSEDFAEYLLGA
jgi:hypothetical protein